MSEIHDKLSKYILVDGFAHVADLEKSHGSWFVDKITGKKYLDCYSLHTSQPLGWNYPKLEKYRDLINKVVFHNITNSDLYTEQYLKFVESFAEVTSDFKHYFFISGGTLAVENSLKAAFDWKAQRMGITDQVAINNMEVIHFNKAFHGRSGYTLSLTNTGDVKTRFFPQWDWPRLIIYKDDVLWDVLEERLKHGFVAAIIVEPIQGEGGDIHFKPEFFYRLRQLTHQYDTMLILDEIQTGLGLTGKMWAYQHYNIIPDLLVFGKKVQVSGFCSTDRIDYVVDNVFKVSGRINSTWGGNLIDMVRSTIYLEIIKEDDLVENARVVGEYFLSKLRELPLSNIRGRGLMIAFDHPDRDEFLYKLNEKIFCLKCGHNSIRFRPHLTFSKEDVDFAINYIKSII